MKDRFKDLTSEDIEKAINSWIHHERNRKILKRRLVDGIHFEPLAEEFNLTPQQVKNIVRIGTETIFDHIGK